MTDCSLACLDVDSGRWYRCAAYIPTADIHHQLKGRHSLQLIEGGEQCHLLILTETMQAHDHYNNYYFYPNHTETGSLSLLALVGTPQQTGLFF